MAEILVENKTAEDGRVEGQVPGDVRKELIVPTWRLVLMTMSLCTGLFMSLLDGSIVATALLTIGTDFNAIQSANWIPLTYNLADVGLAVIWGALGDVFGRRNSYLAAFIIFVVFSLACGFAQSMNQLLAFRTLQGAGGSGLYALSFVIFVEIYPTRLRPFIGALAGGTVAVAGVLGPTLGGAITHYTTWRWIFWIRRVPLIWQTRSDLTSRSCPIGTLAALVFIIAYPKAHQMQPIARRKLHELDFLGCGLLIAAAVLVVFAFQEAGQAGLGGAIRTSALFIVPLVLGCVCWVGLFVWQWIISHHYDRTVLAIFPIRLVKHRVYISAVVQTVLSGFPLLTMVYIIPLRLQVVNGKDALAAGIGILPLIGTSAVGSVIAGGLNSKKDHSFPILAVASGLITLGCGLLSTLGSSEAVEHKLYGFQVFVGFGFGLTVAAVTGLGSIATQLRDASIGISIVAQARLLGGSLGIAASSAILGVNQRRLLTGLISQSELASLQTSAESFSPQQLQALRLAYSDAFRETMQVCTAVSGLAMLVALSSFRRKPLWTVQQRRKEQAEEEEKRMRGDSGGGEGQG